MVVRQTTKTKPLPPWRQNGSSEPQALATGRIERRELRPINEGTTSRSRGRIHRMNNPTATEPTEAYPPVGPFLRRIGYAIGGVLIFLLLVRLGWGWYAQHALDSALADTQKRGHPLNDDQLVASLPPMAAADDAAPLLRRAVGMMGQNSMPNQFPFSPADAAEIDGICRDYPGALELFHEATKLKTARWDLRLDGATPFSRFRDTKTIAEVFNKLLRLTYLVALLEHQRHQDNLAVEHLLDGMRVSNLMDTTGSLWGHLVVAKSGGMFSQAVRRMASELDIGPALKTDSGAVDRRTVQSLMDVLGDETSMWKGFEQSFDGQRVMIITDISTAQWTWLYTPLGQMNLVRVLRGIDAQQEASKGTHWPEV
jgi:hypothetical protein